MDLAAFRKSLSGRTPPAGLNELLEALWHEAKGNWDRAHKIAQSHRGKAAAAVHAYLHRREGDLSNADYWYERAGRERSSEPLDDEWQALALALLSKTREQAWPISKPRPKR